MSTFPVTLLPLHTRTTMVDFRVYAELEEGLHAHLLRAWSKYAATQYAAISEAVKAQDWPTAYALAQALDLTDVVAGQTDFIRATLKTCALFGARMAGSEYTNLLSSLDFGNTLDKSMSVFMRGVEWNASMAIQDSAAQLIAEAQASVVQKAEKKPKPRFVKEFVSFRKEGDAALQLVSSLHTSRMSTWGFTGEADLLGEVEYELSAVLDGRTSDFCRLINGKKFKVVDARKSIVEILSLEDPNDAKTLQPWPKQTKDALAEFATMSAEELTQRNLHIPPFHPRCRTMLVKLGQAPRLEKPKRVAPKVKPVPPVVGDVPVVVSPGEKPKGLSIPKPPDPVNQPLLPETLSTPETFKVVGVDAGQDKVDHWNGYIGVSPVDVLATLSDKTPAEVVKDAATSKATKIKFLDNGDIQIKTTAKVGDKGEFRGRVTFNPYTGTLYKDFADFKKAEKVDAIKFLRRLEANQILAAQSMGAKVVVAAVGPGEAFAYLQLGYLPTEVQWSALRNGMLEDVAGPLAEKFALLPKAQQKMVLLLLATKDAQAMRALADLGTPFVKELLQDLSFEAGIQVNLPAVLAKNKKAL